MRPVSITMGPGDYAAEAIALLGLLANMAVVAIFWPLLPEKVPAHVGPSGLIDAFGDRSTLLIVFVAFPFAIYLMMTLVSRFPQYFKYPGNVREDNAAYVYSLGIGLLRGIKTVMAWTLALMALWFMAVLPYDPGQSGFTLYIALAFIGASLILIIYYRARMSVAGA